jgi:ABC-type dipeptide/oligopeptide/nickel transport system ATPase subunit
MDKIEEARAKLPLPELMREMGYGEFAKSSVKSPFRDEKSPSWGIYEKAGRWKFLDHGTGEGGDEIDFIEQVENIDRKAAIERFLAMAGIERQEKKPPATKYSLNGSKTNSKSWVECQAQADDAFLQKLADERKISVETMRWAKEIGILGRCGEHPAFKCGTGYHFRVEDGGWRFEPRGMTNEALVFGNKDSKEVYVFESQWDALAIAHSVGIDEAATKLWVVTRGASNGKLAAPYAEKRTIIAFPQNDAPKSNGKVPGEEWMADIIDSCAKGLVLRVEIPRPHKDANDWVEEGATRQEIIAAIRSAGDPLLSSVEMQTFSDLWKYKPEEDKTILLGNRWVCQGGQLLLVGQSGIGKSSLTVQAAMTWALGMPFFGIVPVRPLKSLFVQAENDGGDMAEIVQGVMHHVILNSKMPMDEAAKVLQENVTFARVTAQVSDDFVKVVGRLLDRHGERDLVFGDPLLSYVGGDISRQEVMSHFLRQLCNPLAFQRKFAWVWSHHTGKPQSDSKARSHWNTNDFAYIGMGSSELTNWARAIAVLQTTKHEGIFRLLLAKRGKRANVVDEFAQTETEIILKHADTGLHWEPATIPEDEQEAAKGPGAPSKINELIYAEVCAFKESWTGTTKQLWIEVKKKWGIVGKTFKNYEKKRQENGAGKK